MSSYDNLIDTGEFDWESLTIDQLTSDEVIEQLGDPEVDKITYVQNRTKLLNRAKELRCLSIIKDFLKILERETKKT